VEIFRGHMAHHVGVVRLGHANAQVGAHAMGPKLEDADGAAYIQQAEGPKEHCQPSVAEVQPPQLAVATLHPRDPCSQVSYSDGPHCLQRSPAVLPCFLLGHHNGYHFSDGAWVSGYAHADGDHQRPPLAPPFQPLPQELHCLLELLQEQGQGLLRHWFLFQHVAPHHHWAVQCPHLPQGVLSAFQTTRSLLWKVLLRPLPV